VPDVTVLIGTADGELFRYEKGAVTAETPLYLGSSSKLYTGLAIWSVIQSGTLSIDSNPQDAIDFWTDDPNDLRSQITLGQLLSFTSGFNSGPGPVSCPGVEGVTLRDCIQTLHDDGVASEPGTGFAYGPDHMQIAALMVRDATGRELGDILREDIWDAAGASDATALNDASDNIRYSANMTSTPEDYGKVLSRLLAGNYFPINTGYLADRIAGTETLGSIRAISESGIDWHYGSGFWIECDTIPFSDTCAESPTISSPGVFGFLPWVDFDKGYWAVIGVEQRGRQDPIASRASLDFQQMIQPLIEAQFD